MHSQNDTINVTDSLGKKQGYWIVKGKDKPNTCYAPNQIVETGFYKDGRKTGIWKEFYCNGNKKNELNFKDGRPSGSATMYHENGKISETGTWERNRWVGDYKLYYENGQIQYNCLYNESGKRDGKQFYFHKNGKIAIIAYTKEGKEDSCRKYFDNGKIQGFSYFNNGKCDSCKSYFENGKIEKIFFKDKVKIIFNRNGNIKSKIDCSKEACDCEEKENYSEPKNSKEILFNEKKQVIGAIINKNGKTKIIYNDFYYNDKMKKIYFIDDTSKFNDALIKKVKH
ncbi:MAG: hypothetical protein SFY56_11690 [Bacteroidota bacterium]|nr:hypothetical protein [Bacteroidota bacterium]